MKLWKMRPRLREDHCILTLGEFSVVFLVHKTINEKCGWRSGLHWNCPSRRTVHFWHSDAWLYCPWVRPSTCSSLLAYHPFSVPTHGKPYDLQTKPNWRLSSGVVAVHIVYHFLHFPINAAPVLTSNIHTPQEEVTSPPPVKMDLR